MSDEYEHILLFNREIKTAQQRNRKKELWTFDKEVYSLFFLQTQRRNGGNSESTPLSPSQQSWTSSGR